MGRLVQLQATNAACRTSRRRSSSCIRIYLLIGMPGHGCFLYSVGGSLRLSRFIALSGNAILVASRLPNERNLLAPRNPIPQSYFFISPHSAYASSWDVATGQEEAIL